MSYWPQLSCTFESGMLAVFFSQLHECNRCHCHLPVHHSKSPRSRQLLRWCLLTTMLTPAHQFIALCTQYIRLRTLSSTLLLIDGSMWNDASPPSPKWTSLSRSIVPDKRNNGRTAPPVALQEAIHASTTQHRRLGIPSTPQPTDRAGKAGHGPSPSRLQLRLSMRHTLTWPSSAGLRAPARIWLVSKTTTSSVRLTG